MSFRTRLALVAAAAVGLAVVAASVVVYVVVRGDLRAQADRTLVSRAAEVAHAPLRNELGPDGKEYLDVPPFFESVHVEVVRSDRSPVAVTCSVVSVSRRTGASAVRATSSPSAAATRMPPSAITTSRIPIRCSVRVTSLMSRAISIA